MSGYTIMSEEEIKEMVNTCNCYHGCACCPYNPEDISRFIGDKWKGGCPNYDRKLVYAMGQGYGDLSRCKAEIERLRQQIRDTDRMARNSIEQYKNNYDKVFERLKAQQREIDRLTQVAQEAQTEAYGACQKQFVEQVNQAKIDAFNKLKEKIVERMGDREYMGVKYKQGVFSESEIDEMIAEVQNGEDKC